MAKGSKRFNPWKASTENSHRPFYAQAMVNRPNPAIYVVLGKGTTARSRGVELACCRDGGVAFDLANDLADARGYGAGDEGDARVFYVRGKAAEIEAAATDESEAAE